MLKLTKGKNSSCIVDIEKRHHTAEEYTFHVTTNYDNVWLLTSEEFTYFVAKTKGEPCCSLATSTPRN
ncbi:hypothetical protein NQ317_010786 [Molorchus minor]|uniref:Uncharacterized protein n=1 Tax=Molorchus minor TaxID=1323400 RepID=A0ABQ9J537_9CUCU|nr:hypothetical protein NQ317_010786 [Molorchus minor]